MRQPFSFRSTLQRSTPCHGCILSAHGMIFTDQTQLSVCFARCLAMAHMAEACTLYLLPVLEKKYLVALQVNLLEQQLVWTPMGPPSEAAHIVSSAK